MKKNYFSTIHQVISVGHWITDSVHKSVKEFGMTEPQYNVLRTLDFAKSKPISVQTIQKNMVQRSSNVTRIIDRLLSKGYVNRHECPSNRRKMDITITKEGKSILKKMDRKVYAIHISIVNNLELDEMDHLRKLLIKLKGNNND